MALRTTSGSTTIVGYLMDLLTGADLAVSAVMNPQMVYGDDLVSRISFATTQENGAAVLQSAAVDALNRIAQEPGRVGGDQPREQYIRRRWSAIRA